MSGHTDRVERLTAADAGCWVDGWWGQYGPARAIVLLSEHGWRDPAVRLDTQDAVTIAQRHLAAMGPSQAEPITEDEHEDMLFSLDEAENWANQYLAPEGHAFGWVDGEFFLWAESYWLEGDDPEPDEEEPEHEECAVHPGHHHPTAGLACELLTAENLLA